MSGSTKMISLFQKRTSRIYCILLILNYRLIKEKNEELQSTIAELNIKNAMANSQVLLKLQHSA